MFPCGFEIQEFAWNKLLFSSMFSPMLSLMLHYPSKLIDAHQKPLQGLCNGLTVASHWRISMQNLNRSISLKHLPVSLCRSPPFTGFSSMEGLHYAKLSRSLKIAKFRLSEPFDGTLAYSRLWCLKGPKTAKFKRWNRRVEVQALNPKLWNLSFEAQTLKPKLWSPDFES